MEIVKSDEIGSRCKINRATPLIRQVDVREKALDSAIIGLRFDLAIEPIGKVRQIDRGPFDEREANVKARELLKIIRSAMSRCRLGPKGRGVDRGGF